MIKIEKERFVEAMEFREILEDVEKTANDVKMIETWDKDKLDRISASIRELLVKVYQQGFEDGLRFNTSKC